MKSRLFALALLLLAIIIHYHWFFNWDILTSSDWGYYFIESQKELLSTPNIWSLKGLGGIDLGITMYLIALLWGGVSSFANFAVSERVIYFFPSVIFSISIYFFLKNNIKSHLASFIGALVFTYNSYFMIIRTGHLTLAVAYALTPLALLLFQKTLTTKKVIYALLTALVLFIIGSYEFRALYIVLWILFFFFIFFTLILEKYYLKRFILNSFLAGFAILVMILLNLYWILPFSRIGAVTSSGIFSRSLFGNEFLNIANAFTLFHPFWTGGKPTEFIVQQIPFYFWIIPIAALSGLYLQRKNTFILFFGFIALLGILLTKQVGLPFSGFYEWMYTHFPGFNAYREASKFFFIVALAYSVLIAGLIDWLMNHFQNSKWQKTLTYGICLCISLLFLWNTKPAITGELGTLFVPRHVPSDYEKITNFIISQPEFFRTFWVPTFSRWSIYTNNHPVTSAVDQAMGPWNSFIKRETEANKLTEGELIISLLQKPQANSLLDAASVKYIFIPLLDKENDDDFFRYYFEKRRYYITEIDKLSYLKRIDLGLSHVLVYENEDYNQHISIRQEKTESPSVNTVLHTISSQTVYTFTLSKVKEPFILNFAESYHPNWKLRVGEVNWKDIITNENYALPEKNHERDLAGLNIYKLDPANICRNYSCKKNQDGSYDIKMSLFFKPQAYTYIGSFISSVTGLLAVLSIFILYIKQKRYENK